MVVRMVMIMKKMMTMIRAKLNLRKKCISN